MENLTWEDWADIHFAIQKIEEEYRGADVQCAQRGDPPESTHRLYWREQAAKYATLLPKVREAWREKV